MLAKRTWIVDLPAGRTCIERTGNGEPLVLLPSILVRAKTYLWLIERLRRRFTVYVPEPPGSGAGAALAQPWSFEQYADWLLQFVDAFRLARPTVLSHSNSAPIAVLAAAQSPASIGRLILADPTGFARRKIWQLCVGRFVDGVIEAPFSMNALRDVAFNAWHHWPTMMEQIRLTSRSDLWAEVPRIEVPTMIAWGRFDFTFPLSAGVKLHERLPRSRLYVSDGGSHDWLVQHAGAFAAAVDDFMTRT
jgi:3-oxoadipate enol-lactonase